jgi:predicted nuclease of predicted toxin-antitoxin system
VGTRFAARLRAHGHEVEFVGDWPRDPGDQGILQAAHENCQLLVTLDKDFGELIFSGGQAHFGVIRLTHDLKNEQRMELCLKVLTENEPEYLSKCVVTANRDGTYRITKTVD